MPVLRSVGQATVSGAVPVHGPGRGQQMTGQPVLLGEHVKRRVRHSEIDTPDNVNGRNGIEAAFEHGMPVLLHPVAVEPSADLERSRSSRPQQRLRLTLKHALPEPGALSERFRVDRWHPAVNRGTQLWQ